MLKPEEYGLLTEYIGFIYQKLLNQPCPEDMNSVEWEMAAHRFKEHMDIELMYFQQHKVMEHIRGVYGETQT